MREERRWVAEKFDRRAPTGGESPSHRWQARQAVDFLAAESTEDTMGEESRNWTTPRLTEDVQPVFVSGPPEYAHTTEEPVFFVEVAGLHGLLGYLWAADEDDAAGFVPHDEGDAAQNAAVAWVAYLRDCKKRELNPTQALAALVERDYTYATYVASSVVEVAPSLSALKERAACTE